MGKIVRIICDICEKEINPNDQAFSNWVGKTIKMNQKAEIQSMMFEGYYCGDCSDKILEKINEIKNANNNSTE